MATEEDVQVLALETVRRIQASFAEWAEAIGKLAAVWAAWKTAAQRGAVVRRPTPAWTRTARTRATAARRRRLPDGRIARAVVP